MPRGRKPTNAPAAKTINLRSLVAEAVPETDVATVTRQAGNRDETQLYFDQKVRDAYSAWKDAGKPEKISGVKGIWFRIRCTPDDAEVVRSGLRRGATFERVALRLPASKTHVDGTTIVNYAVTDPRPGEVKHGTCGVCDRTDVRITQRGLLAKHKINGEECPNSSQTPL